MNTEQLLEYIEAKTGSRPSPSTINKYIENGLLKRTFVQPDGWRSGRPRNDFTQQAADKFIDAYFRSLSIPDAMEQLSAMTGRKISRDRLMLLCEDNADILIQPGSQWRIPPAALKPLANALRAQFDAERKPKITYAEGQSLLDDILEYMSQAELSRRIGVSEGLISKIKNGSKRMSKNIYDKLSEIEENML